jgi:hypothetical protein
MVGKLETAAGMRPVLRTNKGENRAARTPPRPPAARHEPAAFAAPVAPRLFPAMPDPTANFLRIDRESPDGRSRHVVVHLREPRFALEIEPDTDAPDRLGQGLIKRVSVPNSWAGQYSHYAALLKAAQEFFRQSFLAPPATKAETHRLRR